MHSVFIYFKAPAAERAQVLTAINALGLAIATATGAVFSSGRRLALDSTIASTENLDTWLEHYQCANDVSARAVLDELIRIDRTHPLLALIDGGFNGRHLEHFADTTSCA